MQSEDSGAVGMLEVIESNVARPDSDTKTAEATAQKKHISLITKSKVEKAKPRHSQSSDRAYQ